jgi:hypothetical protein
MVMLLTVRQLRLLVLVVGSLSALFILFHSLDPLQTVYIPFSQPQTGDAITMITTTTTTAVAAAATTDTLPSFAVTHHTPDTTQSSSPSPSPSLIPVPPVIHRENATFVSLVRNIELSTMMESIDMVERNFNKHFHYPWVFLNDEPFSAAFQRMVALKVSGSVEFGLIPKVGRVVYNSPADADFFGRRNGGIQHGLIRSEQQRRASG